MCLKPRGGHIQAETINNNVQFAVPTGASNICVDSIIDGSGDSTLDTGFITETVTDSPAGAKCPRFDADLGSSVDSLEASQPDIVKVPSSSKPSARSMNVAAATAMLVDMQDEGDDFSAFGAG